MKKKRIFLASVFVAILLVYGAVFTWGILLLDTHPWSGMIVSPKKGERNNPLTPHYCPQGKCPRPGIHVQTAGFDSTFARTNVQMAFVGAPAYRMGITGGDEVVAINTIPVYLTGALESGSNKAKIGDQVVYRIRRAGRTLDIPLRLEAPLKSIHVRLRVAANILVLLVFLIIGFFVYLARPDDRRALIFCIMSVVAAACFLVTAIQGEWMNAFGLIRFSTVFWFIGVYLLFGTLFGAMLLHLALVFPRERPIVSSDPKIIRKIYGLPLMVPVAAIGPFLVIAVFASKSPRLLLTSGILAAMAMAAAIVVWQLLKAARLSGWKRMPLQHPYISALALMLPVWLLAGSLPLLARALQIKSRGVLTMGAVLLSVAPMALIYLVVLSYPVLTCLELFRSYKDSGVEERKQVQWPLWGTFVAVAGPFTIHVLLFIASFVGSFRAQAVSPPVTSVAEILPRFFSLLIPVSFAIAIFKYRLMNIDVLIRKTIVYSALSGIVVVLYLSLVGGVGGLVFRFTGVESQTVTIFSTLAVAAIFLPARNRVQGFVDRRFFRKKYEYPQALRILGKNVSESSSLRELLKSVAEHLVQVLQNRGVLVFTRDGAEQEYTVAAKVGLSDQLAGKLRFARNCALVKLMRNGALSEDEKALGDARLSLRSLGEPVLVPLKVKDDLLGFLILGAKLSDLDYDDEDRDFLTSAAELLAAGLRNSRIREEEREFSEAQEIQQGLLPKELPQLPGYGISGAWQPARVVGGDYFDVLRLGENRLAICIADVSGKGMPAALLMSNLQAAVKAFTTDTVTPRELTEKVNRVICSNIAPGKFITFVYCILDAATGVLCHTNAGHNPVLLMRGDGSVVKLEASGAVLGVFRDWKYEQAEVCLSPGDRVLFYTDGVSEARNQDDEEFGEDRLAAVMRTHASADAAVLQQQVMRTVTEFCEGNFHDDATVVVLSVGG